MSEQLARLEKVIAKGDGTIDVLGTVKGYPESYNTLVEIPAVTKDYPNGFYAVTGETRGMNVGIKINGINTDINNSLYGTNLVNLKSSASSNNCGVNLWYYNIPLKSGDILSAKSAGSSGGTTTFFAVS